MERRGILAAGNFIVDQVKIIDAYPEQDTLANILSVKSVQYFMCRSPALVQFSSTASVLPLLR